jgi:hypothetical protein
MSDVKVVFERLMSASENHLRAFQNAVDRNCTGTGLQNEKLNNTVRGCGRGNGGNRNNTMGSCLLK